MSKRNITLAIESAISGGSLSLFNGSSVIDRWWGENDVSRSEELLTTIGEILKKNLLGTKDLSCLAVSLGPGSYTGARIGISTAIGLKNGLDIECFGVSIFDALFYSFGNTKSVLVAVLPFGKNEVCFQFHKKEFNKNDATANSPKIFPFDKFVQLILADSDLRLITNQKLCLKLKGIFSDDIVINAGVYLSDYVGGFIINKKESDNIIPIYVHSTSNKNLL